MNRQSIWAGHLADRHIWLERSMDDLTIVKRLFDDVVRLLERLFQIAAADMRAECDVGSGSPLKMLEVWERRGRFEYVVDDRSAGFCCGNFVEHRFEGLVLHRDQIRRLVGHVRILSQRHRDRLAGISYFLERENRLVVKCRAVIWIGNEPP